MLPDRLLESHGVDKDTLSPIGEPVRRPDGFIVELAEASDEVGQRFVIAALHHTSCGAITNSYTTEEVTGIGEGDYSSGLMKLGRAFFTTDYDTLSDATTAPFRDEAHHITPDRIF